MELIVWWQFSKLDKLIYFHNNSLAGNSQLGRLIDFHINPFIRNVRVNGQLDKLIDFQNNSLAGNSHFDKLIDYHNSLTTKNSSNQ